MNIETMAPVLAAWAKMQAANTGASPGEAGKQEFNTLFLLALFADTEHGQEVAPATTPVFNRREGRGKAAPGSQQNRPAIPLPTSTNIQGLIEPIAARYNLPPELLRGVVAAESSFDPRAVSPAGAMGLMQLMPATARALGVSDPFDPAANLDGGARYLRQLLDRFQGDTRLALAAYNAGPGAVERYQGVPPYRETQAYIQRVLTAASRFEGLA